MKKITAVILCILMILGATVGMTACNNNKKDDVSKTDTTITVVSYNIRLFTLPDNPNDWWPMRKTELCAHITELNPDLLGTQEVLPNQRDDLKEYLSAYTHVGVGRDDGDELGESSSIFFRTERFTLLDSGWFWLSETPDVPSLGWDAVCIRICTFVVLKDKLTEKTFTYFNTHFDHIGDTAQKESANMISGKIAQSGRAAIVTGDFNVTAQSEAYATITENLVNSSDIAAEKTEKCTYNSWGNTSEQCTIDFCFLSPGSFDVASYAVSERTFPDPNAEEGTTAATFYASDHNAVVVKLKQK